MLTTIAMVLTASPAHAQQSKPLAAGDTITHGNNECTLGYVYRVHGHTMGVSAGHCADREADNADFFAVENPAEVGDAEFSAMMMQEFPGWLAAARSRGIVKPA